MRQGGYGHCKGMGASGVWVPGALGARGFGYQKFKGAEGGHGRWGGMEAWEGYGYPEGVCVPGYGCQGEGVGMGT